MASSAIIRSMLCTMFVVQSVSVSAQSIRFSQFYNHPNGGAGLLQGVISLDNGDLMATGNSLNGSNGYREAHRVRVDESGVLISEAVVVSNVGQVNSQAVIRSSNGMAIFESGYICDYSVSSPEYCDYYFTRLDETGDTLFTKVYERRDTCDFVLDMVQTRPNKIMLIGWTCNDTTQDNTELMFITVDTLGNEVNRVVWGGGGTDYINAGLVVDETGDVIMAGYTQSFGGGGNGRTWVVRTDSIGIVKWHKTYSGMWGPGSSAARIAKLSNGNLIVAGGGQSFGSSAFGVDATLMEIDTAGNQIWAREYEVVGGQGLWGVVSLEDGTIISCGVTDDGMGGSQAGWLIKTDENGDTLWTRTYDSSDLIDYLRNMIVLPNGDIVMVGHGRAPDQTNQDGWILRVDSMGCLVEGCGAVGIEEQLVIDNEQFSIRPNPASEVLNLELLKQGVSEVHLYDMAGKLLFQKQTTQLREVIDVSALENGLYLLTVLQGEMKTTMKVMVQH